MKGVGLFLGEPSLGLGLPGSQEKTRSQFRSFPKKGDTQRVF